MTHHIDWPGPLRAVVWLARPVTVQAQLGFVPPIVGRQTEGSFLPFSRLPEFPHPGKSFRCLFEVLRRRSHLTHGATRESTAREARCQRRSELELPLIDQSAQDVDRGAEVLKRLVAFARFEKDCSESGVVARELAGKIDASFRGDPPRLYVEGIRDVGLGVVAPLQLDERLRAARVGLCQVNLHFAPALLDKPQSYGDGLAEVSRRATVIQLRRQPTSSLLEALRQIGVSLKRLLNLL